MTKQPEQPTARSTSVRIWPDNDAILDQLKSDWHTDQSGAINRALFALWTLKHYGSRQAQKIIAQAGKDRGDV